MAVTKFQIWSCSSFFGILSQSCCVGFCVTFRRLLMGGLGEKFLLFFSKMMPSIFLIVWRSDCEFFLAVKRFEQFDVFSWVGNSRVVKSHLGSPDVVYHCGGKGPGPVRGSVLLSRVLTEAGVMTHTSTAATRLARPASESRWYLQNSLWQTVEYTFIQKTFSSNFDTFIQTQFHPMNIHPRTFSSNEFLPMTFSPKNGFLQKTHKWDNQQSVFV